MLLKHHGVTSDNISVVVTLDEQRMRAKLAKKLAVIHITPHHTSSLNSLQLAFEFPMSENLEKRLPNNDPFSGDAE